MKTFARFLAIAVVLASASCHKKEPVAAAKPRRVLVAAAASLRDLLEKTAPEFRAARPGCELVFTFDASSVLARQISEGAGIAVFLSADADSVDKIGAKAAAGTRRVFLANRLRLIGPAAGAEFTPQSVSAGHKAALCGSEVPAGKAWRKYLDGKGWLAAIDANSTAATNVRAALASFDTEAVEFAFVYATDVRASKRAHREWAPPDGPVTTYVAAEVAGNGSDDSKAFLEWLGGASFRAEAKAEGFEEPQGK